MLRYAKSLFSTREHFIYIFFSLNPQTNNIFSIVERKWINRGFSVCNGSHLPFFIRQKVVGTTVAYL